MSRQESIAIVLEAFRAVESRDEERLRALYHPEVEFHWPPSLQYGGTFRGAGLAATRQGPTWDAIWDPLQPTEAERRLDPRVVAASDEEVVVLWRQRGVSPTGERIDQPVLGLYEVRDSKFARAQMFYFDTVAVARFLAEAGCPPAVGSQAPEAKR